MPNWCENDLYIYGGRRHDIVEAIRGDEAVIDFEKIIPMPDGLKETTKGSRSSEAEVLLGWSTGADMLNWAWVKEAGVTTIEELKAHLVKRNPELPAIAENMKALKEQTGYADWYEWSVNNWGTKWNATEGMCYAQRTRIRLTFWTAWSPPVPIVEALSEKYPTTKFSLRFYECGVGFKGHYAMKGGKVLADVWNDSYRGRRGG
jgi:hypothetical protein